MTSSFVDIWKATPVVEGPAAHRLPKIADILSESGFGTARALVVADRRGLLLSCARRGRDSQPHNVKSVTKSVISLLVGAAILEGALTDETVPLFGIAGFPMPPDVPLASDLTLAHLLTMQSGIVWDEWGRRYRDPARMFRAADPCRHVLTRGFRALPGTSFRYSTGDSQILVRALVAAVGEPLQSFAARALFDPLGLGRPKWLTGRDGLPFGGAHLYLSAQDMVRIGQLCLANGVWNGHRLVSEGWIGRSTQVHSGEDWWEGPYGYHWWVRRRGFAAYGYGGQVLFVAPEEGLVCAFTAASNRRTHIPIATVEDRIIYPVLDALGTRNTA